MSHRHRFYQLIIFAAIFTASYIRLASTMEEYSGYRPRSAFARAALARIQEDRVHKGNKHEHWYYVDVSKLHQDLCDKYVPLHQDEETEQFLDSCMEKADWFFTQMFQSLASTLLSFFMTKTSINGLLGRGSMFVLSHLQFERLLGLSPVNKAQNMIDLGAGDGEVTKILAYYFNNIYATEISQQMRKLLSNKGFQLLEVDNWHKNGSITFDLVSCLNLLDRCDKPITLLRSMHQSLRPETGRVLAAVVIPFKPYVEYESQDHVPTEKLQITGATFEEQVSQLTTAVFQPAGFEVEAFTRVPYLCQGDLRHSFYVLTDAVFVLKSSQIVTAS